MNSKKSAENKGTRSRSRLPSYLRLTAEQCISQIPPEWWSTCSWAYEEAQHLTHYKDVRSFLLTRLNWPYLKATIFGKFWENYHSWLRNDWKEDSVIEYLIPYDHCLMKVWVDTWKPGLPHFNEYHKNYLATRSKKAPLYYESYKEFQDLNAYLLL